MAGFVADSKFKQQKLPAWKPILTPKSVLPVFFAIGALFIGLGAGLLKTSNDVRVFGLHPFFSTLPRVRRTNYALFPPRRAPPLAHRL